jgi:tetraacyldisaccharide-1-P 4'-kinase
MKKLLAQAQSHKATLVTTAKDIVRVPTQYRSHVTVADMGVVFDSPAQFDALLNFCLSQHV